jgi:prepilin-type processing-associated H-X9-DG protein
MKPRLSKKRNQAMDIVDLLVIIAVIAILTIMLLPVLAANKRRAANLACISNLKGISFSFRIWEGDHDNQYPMSVSVANRGAMELIDTGNVAGCFQRMTNVLGSPKILICPLDTERTPATNFQNDFNNSHINYFVNADATEAYPQEMILGDDNLATNGVPVKPGLLEFSTNTVISWTSVRHRFAGNVAFADGSVGQIGNSGLTSETYLTDHTNRLAIP